MRLSIIIIILVTKMALVTWLMTWNDRLRRNNIMKNIGRKKKTMNNISLWMTVIKWRLNNRNGFIRRWTDYKHVDLWGRRSPPSNSLLLDFSFPFFFFFKSADVLSDSPFVSVPPPAFVKTWQSKTAFFSSLWDTCLYMNGNCCGC